MNADMPFDRFSIEQLAGDLLPDSTVSQKIATGFHRTPTCNVEAGVHPEENRVNQVFDRVNATGLTWLGTTLECAQCHSHKYDPFSQEEYFKLFAFFNNTPLEVRNKSGKGVSFDFWGPKMDLPLGVDEAKEFDRLNSELVSLKGALEAEQKKAERAFPLWVKEMKKRAERPDFQAPDWKVAPIKEASSDGKETFELLEDGSVLATGKSGDRSTYFLKAEAGGGKWKALRLEALLHTSMQKKGPGRNLTNANPNFVLTEILVYRRNGDLREPIPFNRAWASFSQSNFGAGQLIDGNLDSRNGWAIAPRFGESHQAYFEFGESLDLEKPAMLEIVMKHLYGGGRNVGRPRISLATVFPPEEKESKRLYALAGKKKRSKADEKELKKLFLLKETRSFRLREESVKPRACSRRSSRPAPSSWSR